MVKYSIKWYGSIVKVNTEKDMCIWSSDEYSIYVHIARHGEEFFYVVVDGEVLGMWKWDVENFIFGIIIREIFEKKHFPEENIRKAEKVFSDIREYAEKKKREYEIVYGGKL